MYRLPWEPLGSYAISLCLLAGVCLPLAAEMSAHPAHSATGIVIFAMAFLPFAALWLWLFRRLARVGIEVSERGVRSVSLNQVVSAQWCEISRFEISRGALLGSSIAVRRQDGSTVYMDGLGRSKLWEDVRIPYCDALNAELERAQDPLRRKAR